MIQNLSQLKKSLVKNAQFEIIAHCRPECVGQRRQVTLANTQGFYSIVPDEPQSKITLANNGRGSVLWWSKAPFWQFENGVCSIYNSDTNKTSEYLIMSFQMLEDKVR